MSTAPASAGPARLAVLLSGGGRTLANLLERIDADSLRASVGLVIASRECGGAEIARRRGIATEVIPGPMGTSAFGERLDGAGIDLVVLAGYLQLAPIPPGYTNRIVNIHPALLPSFGGPGMFGDRVHAAVLAAGCKVSGCTVHLCDERYDRGPILAQRACPVHDDDTVESLGARVFEMERGVFPEAIGWLIDGRVRVEDGRAFIDR